MVLMNMTSESGQLRNVGRIILASLGLGTLLLSCGSIEEFAPPIREGVLTSVSSAANSTLVELQEGRGIYLDECISCHAARPIDDYSLVEWDAILKRMNPESNLSASEATVLRKYIRVAHEMLTSGSVSSAEGLPG